MAYITPKTNWVSTDRFNIVDFNRIKNNLEYFLYNDQYVSYGGAEPIPDMTNYRDNWNVDNFNSFESWLEMLADAYGLSLGSKKTFYVNGPFIDFSELNRIESGIQRLRNSSQSGSLASGYLIYTDSGSTRKVTGIKTNELVRDNVTTLIIPTYMNSHYITF